MTTRARILGGGLAAAVAIAAPMGAWFEGVFPMGHADPVGIPTDCVGETEGARIGVQRFTAEECLARYAPRLARNWDALTARCVFRDVTVPQAGALISWSDNVGITAACGSTLVRMLNAGAPPDIWCAQLSRWTYATRLGVTFQLPGLVKRRAAERAMCMGGNWSALATRAGTAVILGGLVLTRQESANDALYDFAAVLGFINGGIVVLEEAA